KGAEGLAGKAFGGNGLLRVVEPLAVRVLRADQHGAGRARGRYAMSSDRAVHAKEISIIAQHLEVVTRVIPGAEAIVVQHGPAHIGGHLEVAAEASGRPGSVAGVAGHGGVAVGELRIVSRSVR